MWKLQKKAAASLPPAIADGRSHLRRFSPFLSRTGTGRVLGPLVTALQFLCTGGAKHSRAAGRQGSRNSDQYPGESITGIPFRHTGNSRYGIVQTGEDGRSAPGCPVGRGCSGVVSPVVIKSVLQSVVFYKSTLVASSVQLAVDIFSSVKPFSTNTVYMPH